MSGGVRLHVALAVAGVLGGLPVAAVTQWLRPDPGTVWRWRQVPLITEPEPQEYGVFEVGRLAIRPEGPGLTLCSVEVVAASSWCGPEVRFHPALLNRAAEGLGLKPRWPPSGWFVTAVEREQAGVPADSPTDETWYPCRIEWVRIR